MSSVNADSMNPAQGEFQPSRPRDEPLTTSGHKPGVLAGEKDQAPEFSAEVLPPGSAPANRTFRPNPQSEVPGQADNEATLRSHGKESTCTDANATLGGATSADVHTGYGHPGQGQTCNELRKEGQHTGKKEAGAGGSGQWQGGSGLRENEPNTEAKRLMREDEGGSMNAREHNAPLAGSESKEPATAIDVAAERD